MIALQTLRPSTKTTIIVLALLVAVFMLTGCDAGNS